MTNPLTTIQNRADLAAFVGGRDDEELTGALMDLGIHDVLRAVFDGMARGYVPEDGPRRRAVVQWDIQDPDRKYHTWQTVADRDGFTVNSSAAEEPDVTLRTELIPFIRLMTKELRGIQALSSGAVKLKGDVQLAIEMEAWFAD